jgi:hypothetical protein
MGRHVKEWKIAENFLVAAALESQKLRFLPDW